MWIKFVGHPDGCDVPIPGSVMGAELHFEYGVPTDVDAALAKRLLEQPTNWRPASAPKDEKAAKAK